LRLDNRADSPVPSAFSWRPALTQSILLSPARLPFGSFLAEHIFTLYTYLASLALSASLLARSQSSAADGGRSYELSPKVSPAERKIRDEHVGRAADALCRAAGVAEHLVPLVGEWERLFDDGGPSSRGGGGIASRLSGGRGSASRPVESSRAFASALAKLLLADAQALSIRKLLSPTLASSPHVGPPLAKGHPSPSLLAKLYLSVLDLYTQAGTLLTSSSSARSKGSDDSTTDGPVSDLVRYVSQNRAFVQALARKWLGVDAGESGKAERMGEAVAWLRDAKATLIEGGASSGGGGSSGGSGGGLLKKSKSKVENRWTEELESVSAFLSAYEKLNNSVRPDSWMAVTSAWLTPLADYWPCLPLDRSTSRRSRHCRPSSRSSPPVGLSSLSSRMSLRGQRSVPAARATRLAAAAAPGSRMASGTWPSATAQEARSRQQHPARATTEMRKLHSSFIASLCLRSRASSGDAQGGQSAAGRLTGERDQGGLLRMGLRPSRPSSTRPRQPPDCHPLPLPSSAASSSVDLLSPNGRDRSRRPSALYPSGASGG